MSATRGPSNLNPLLDKGSALNPMLPSFSPLPFPHSHTLISSPLPSFPTTSLTRCLHSSPGACLITVSVSECARWALSKQILPPACFVYCGGGRRRGGQRGPDIRLLFSPAEWRGRGCRRSKNSLCERGSQRSNLSRNFDSLRDGVKTHKVVGCQRGSEFYYIMCCFAAYWTDNIYHLNDFRLELFSFIDFVC